MTGFEDFNWGALGIGLSAALALVWAVFAVRNRPSATALVVGLAHIVVAGFHSVAPIRGLLDPHYVGYSFGMLSASSGWQVTALAGAVFVLAAVGAFNALASDRRARIRVAATSTLFLVNVGGAWLHNAVTDLRGNVIQFGEYATIPGEAGTALLFVLFVAPFFLGALWAGKRALTPAA